MNRSASSFPSTPGGFVYKAFSGINILSKCTDWVDWIKWKWRQSAHLSCLFPPWIRPRVVGTECRNQTNSQMKVSYKRNHRSTRSMRKDHPAASSMASWHKDTTLGDTVHFVVWCLASMKCLRLFPGHIPSLEPMSWHLTQGHINPLAASCVFNVAVVSLHHSLIQLSASTWSHDNRPITTVVY